MLGHSIGIGPAELPVVDRLCTESPVVLEPGMVFSIEPYWGKLGVSGVRLEDNFVVTEDGCELIAKFPHDSRLCGQKPVSDY